MISIDVWRGTSLSLSVRTRPVVNGAEIASLAGWTVTSQVRRVDRALVATLTVEILDAAQKIIRLSGPTIEWPVAKLACDVVAIGPGGTPIIRSEVFQLDVKQGVTELATP